MSTQDEIFAHTVQKIDKDIDVTIRGGSVTDQTTPMKQEETSGWLIGFNNIWDQEEKYNPNKKISLQLFISQLLLQKEQEVREDEQRKFVSVMDQVLTQPANNGFEEVQGKDLSASTFHYLVFKKLKDLK